MGNEIQLIQQVDQMLPSVEVIQGMKRIAEEMVAAKMLPPGYKSGGDLMVVALRGRELGVPLGQAVQGMFPMKGRIGYMGGFLLSIVNSRYPDSRIRIKESTKERCVLEWKKFKDDEFQTEEFSMEEVSACNYDKTAVWDDAAGRQKTDASGNPIWKIKTTWGDTKNMLYWRCVSRLINRWFSEVFGSQVYQLDELQDIDRPEMPPETKAATGAPYSTQANTPEPVSPVVTEITEVQAEVLPPKTPIEEEKPRMNQKMVDALVHQFEVDVMKVQTKKEVDALFEAFKINKVPGAVLTNMFKIKNQRKAELTK